MRMGPLKGGHLGCSEGYNFNLYKKTLPPQTYSQGWEQLHSILDNCSTSLKQMNYRSYMTFVKVFFCTEQYKK